LPPYRRSNRSYGAEPVQEVEFRLSNDRLTHGGTTRVLMDADRERFADWIAHYHDLAWRTGSDDELRVLGSEIYTWLDGDERWLAALRDNADAPVVAEFAVADTSAETDRRFLEVPWELAATGDGYLAADPALIWAPLRRIGARGTPLAADPKHRLGVMFMAAAPAGQSELEIEAEEAAILRATAALGLDLAVEETGTLPELSIAWNAAASLNVLHLSCHGQGGAEPFLALEDEVGELAKVKLADLAGKLVQNRPRLLFLSACHTGEGGDTLDSLARGLIRAGFPAVLGWADAVFDRDASEFAAAFYERLTATGMTVQTAWGATRFDLLQRPNPPTHWHLARLFLGRSGGGALAAGTAGRQRDDADAGRKAVLEAPGRQIEVASRFEFVGRRRQIQEILRTFRQRQSAGAAILGLGRQGKSSLAARIIDRNPHLTPVVLFRCCDGPSLLGEISRRIDGAAGICARYRDRVDPNRPDHYDADALFHALRALLEGPCGHRTTGGKPILLLLDDFEALLDPPAGADSIHAVQRDAAAPLAAVIRAFEAGGTESRLLLTCRYAFRLSERGQDLAARLRRVDLPAMSPAESLKQARQKLAAAGVEGAAALFRFAAFQPRAIAAARGNAGLQDLLFQAALTDPAAGEAATAALEAHLAGGTLPERQDLRDTLERLLIREILGWLTPGERHLLHASTLVRLPVPLPVWRRYADHSGSGSPDRLLAFGLWERLPDLVDRRTDAAAPNAIGAAYLGDDAIDRSEQVVALILPDLFQAWGGAERSKVPYVIDIELTELALRCCNCDVLAATGADAIRGFAAGFDYRAAAATASATLDALAAAGQSLPIELLRAAAEGYSYVGDAERLKTVFGLAPAAVGDDASLPFSERMTRADFRLSYGNYLARQGEPDLALLELRAAQAAFDALGVRQPYATTLGYIARILIDQGNIEQALKLHHEQVRIFESVNDRRGRAVTLGDIARVLTSQGKVAEALKLHNEQVQILEDLGERRERAIALGDIARILVDMGEFEQALKLCDEQIQLFEALGERRERTIILGIVARIYTEQGNVEEAFKLHDQELMVYEALGDRRSRSITLGQIAHVLANQGEVERALKLHEERLQTYEALQDQSGIASANFDIGLILFNQAMRDEDDTVFQRACEALEKSYRIVLTIDRLDGICAIGTMLGQVLAIRGKMDEARGVLIRSREGFRQLGQAQRAEQVDGLLRDLE